MFDIKRKKLSVEKSPWYNTIQFVLFERKNQNTVAYSKEIIMYSPTLEEQGRMIEPTFSLEPEEAQELMDDLWRIGFRPSEGTGSAGALAATQKHLEDMRKIAFGALEKWT